MDSFLFLSMSENAKFHKMANIYRNECFQFFDFLKH